MTSGPHDHHQHGPHEHGAAEPDDPAFAGLLDLDAEVLESFLSEVTRWIEELAGDRPVRRVLDVGSGTGAGAIALLQRFHGADAVAVDLSTELLHRLSDKAASLGLADRIRTVAADLDDEWPGHAIGNETVDVAWASASLHHLADPNRILMEILAALRHGGLLAVVELDSFPRFLPDDIGRGRAGLEERCHAVLAQARAEALPHIGSDWGARLVAAGYTVEAKRHVDIKLVPPLPPAAGRYAQASLRRMRATLDGRLDADDLEILDALIDGDGPDSVLHREDLTVRAARSIWMGRRP